MPTVSNKLTAMRRHLHSITLMTVGDQEGYAYLRDFYTVKGRKNGLDPYAQTIIIDVKY